MSLQQNKVVAGYSLSINKHLRDEGIGEVTIEPETIQAWEDNPRITDTPHLLMIGSADGKPCFVPVGDLFGAEVNANNVVETVQKIVALLSR